MFCWLQGAQIPGPLRIAIVEIVNVFCVGRYHAINSIFAEGFLQVFELLIAGSGAFCDGWFDSCCGVLGGLGSDGRIGDIGNGIHSGVSVGSLANDWDRLEMETTSRQVIAETVNGNSWAYPDSKPMEKRWRW